MNAKMLEFIQHPVERSEIPTGSVGASSFQHPESVALFLQTLY
jgi:hypothetical protein